MNFLIIGAGAIGSVFGGFLRKAGHSVTLLGRKYHMDAIQENGLRLSGIWGDFTVTGFSAFSDISHVSKDETFDFVLIITKTYNTEQAVQNALPWIQKAKAVVSLQNGLGNEKKISPYAGEEKTILGRVIFGAQVASPGHVHITVNADAVRIGKVTEPREDENVKTFAETVNAAGIPAEFTLNVEHYIWGKVLYNCALNPLGSIIKANYGDLVDNPFSRTVVETILDEAFHVISILNLDMPWKTAAEYKTYFFETLIPPTRSHFPSMLIDIQKRGRTEIDSLNGALVQLGKEKGLRLPVNETLVNIVKAMEGRWKTPR